MFKKLLTALHRFFDPERAGVEAKVFSLDHDRRDTPEPLQSKLPDPEVPPDTPLERLKIRTGVASVRVDKALDALTTDLDADLEVTLGRLKDACHAHLQADLAVRAFDLPFAQPVKAYLVFFAGIVDSQEIDQAVLLPLMRFTPEIPQPRGLDLLEMVDRSLVPGRFTVKTFSLKQAALGLAAGQTAILLDTVPGFLMVDQRKYPSRAVEQPTAEQVVRGPQEGFTEDILTNTGLLRRRLKTPDLILERVDIGRRSRTTINIAYLKGVVNPNLLAELHRRIQYIDVDSLPSSGALEQLLEDSPMGVLPTLQDTQRPDRAAAAISEGRVVMLVEGSPFVLIAPVVFWDFIHNPEDYNIKWPFGTLLRLIRFSGLLVTLLLPALYIAIANFHQEMIPPSLLLAIASSREAVPFPAPLEVVMMEIAFEIIREGSLRIPTVLGQTVGIVGALILGQAAVQANIVSPILVIVVATTALGSFTIPNYSMSLPIRFGRFAFILLAASFGLYGISAGLLFFSAHAASLRSFGVPYMAPSGPRMKGSQDVLFRGAWAQMDLRPGFLQTRNKRRQAQGVMDWQPK